jgi:ABC-type cobalamin/Fe3+-siderophores transport system ATPase subunit
MSELTSQTDQSISAERRKLLSATNLSVAYGDITILQDISFDLFEGEYVAIVGPNGAGKTTLLRTLLGACSVTSGEISLSDKSAESYSSIERAGFLSYVPQARDVPSGFSVREFVEMGFYAKGHRFRHRLASQNQIQRTLEQTGLTGVAGRFLETLSGGELQRVYLAAALAQDALIMLLDEPTTFLDPAHQKEMVSILSLIRSEKQTASALIVTHDLNLAISFADRIIALKDGALVFDGSSEEFCDEGRLQEIYHTKMRFVTDPLTSRQLIVPALLDATSGDAQEGLRR